MNDADLVSVLMPAFKPQFFKETLLSVIDQTHQNLEILVGDNSGEGSIKAIVAEINDPRIVYIPNYQVTDQSPKLNHMILWWRAKGRYVRFVYDDDVIHPKSTEVLLDQIKSIPKCVMAWHQRIVINANGSVLATPSFIHGTESIVLDRALLLDNMIRHNNFVGEPSFVLFDKSRYTNFNFSNYAGVDLVLLWDIAFYLEAAKYGSLVGSGLHLGKFRRHSEQVSMTLSHMFVCLEWELILRNEQRGKDLSQQSFNKLVAQLFITYASSQVSWPILNEFRERFEIDLQHSRLYETMPPFIDAYNELAKDQR